MAQSGDAAGVAFFNALNTSYRGKSDIFTEKDLVAKEPIGQFKNWFELACQKGLPEPHAMCLATATKEGIPSARFVLLKDYGKEGFKFFTNYNSRKGHELAENPKAALVLYWEPLKRSVRIQGSVEKLPAADSDAYFATRWRDSQIGSSVSEQSSVIPNREMLIALEEKMKIEYEGRDILRPECCLIGDSANDLIPLPDVLIFLWYISKTPPSSNEIAKLGGYKVIPESVEFWQGQTDRIHDRIRFRRLKDDEKPDGIMLHEGEDGWVFERLSP